MKKIVLELDVPELAELELIAEAWPALRSAALIGFRDAHPSDIAQGHGPGATRAVSVGLLRKMRATIMGAETLTAPAVWEKPPVTAAELLAVYDEYHEAHARETWTGAYRDNTEAGRLRRREAAAKLATICALVKGEKVADHA